MIPISRTEEIYHDLYIGFGLCGTEVMFGFSYPEGYRYKVYIRGLTVNSLLSIYKGMIESHDLRD